MSSLTTHSWPSARQFAEAIQCPALCFAEPHLKTLVPAFDRLGMPLVTSGQFAYVFKLKAADGGTGAVAVRCFRGYLGDREQRYKAIDAHLSAHHIPALPRFKYFSYGILVAGRRFPALIMQWIEGPTLDVYLDEVIDRPDVLRHLADEWLKLIARLQEAGIAHGDLQHGNIIVEHGQLRLVDLDGMFVPGLANLSAGEVGHQHFQHPARDARLFDATIDNFSALVIYLSLISLAERPELWGAYHDENLIFTKADFLDPASSPLFAEIKSIGTEHRQLAETLEAAARLSPAETPSLIDLVSPKSKLPSWMVAPPDVEFQGQTREATDVEAAPFLRERIRRPLETQSAPITQPSGTVQGIFNSQTPAPALAPHNPLDIRGNTLMYTRQLAARSYIYIWFLFLHRWIAGFWEIFGVGYGGALWLTGLLVAAVFFGYGFVRAVLDWNLASDDPQAAFGTSAVISILQSAPPASALRSAPASVPPAINAPAQATQLNMKPGGRAVVGNSSLGIYHLPDCAWVEKISRQHSVQFASQPHADAAGYRPCRVCAP
ncbi:MAG TPA: Ada metal-binding domain-containing protein [Pyrinomonadaceae bacterium]|nr:Ada metal-binding domain-containing protein [Pyrinomonadaceae bacterium]